MSVRLMTLQCKLITAVHIIRIFKTTMQLDIIEKHRDHAVIEYLLICRSFKLCLQLTILLLTWCSSPVIRQWGTATNKYSLLRRANL